MNAGATQATQEMTAIDLALSASNLAERVRIVAAASDPQAVGDLAPLDALESWHIERTAKKLSAQFAREAERRSAPPAHTADELRATLAAFRRHELAGGSAAAESAARIHQPWLPTYRAALAHANETDHGGRPPWWRRPDALYGRLAIVCAPFLRLLESDLGAATPDGAGAPSALVRDVQGHLLDRCELAIAWAVEAHAKVHCARHGIQAEQAPSAEYLRFLDDTFADATAYHAFFLSFPVLGRWLARLTGLLADEARTLWTRLAADADQVGERFFNQPITAFTGFRFGQGDSHAGARSVARITVELAGGGAGEFVYKPRCVRAEAGMQSLLRRLRADGAMTAATRAVIAMPGYGYEALVPSGRNIVGALDEVRQVYRELGGCLALFYVLGGGDLHLENLIVADGHVHVCDCETVFGVPRVGDRDNMGSLLDSVFRTGLLEWPRSEAGAGGLAEIRISGYSGGGEFELPTPTPQINERRMSFGMAVTHRARVRVAPTPANRVFLGERMMEPQDFTASILAGFDAVYAWFAEGGSSAADAVATCFAGASTRFINWGTQLYSQLLAAVRHPRCLMDPLECDLVFNTLRTLPPKHRDDPALLECELDALWRWDTPIFTAPVDADQLLSDHQPPAIGRLSRTPLAHAAERIRALSPENHRRQTAYVAASLATSAQDESLAAACVAHAAQIGERLCRMLRDPADPTPWTSFRMSGARVDEMAIEADLYNGSAGAALFLAYLDAHSPTAAFRSAAERAFAHALATQDQRRIGAFTGLAGLVYLMTHLSALWNDRGLLDRAVALTRRLDLLIDDDRHFDVLSGSAGVIAVLLGLAERADGAGLDVAERCARHLLRNACVDGDTLSWPAFDPTEVHANLTGLAHGAGGIGWTLIALGRRLGRPEFVDAGRRAFRHEARTFDDAEGDWPDLRRFAAPGNRPGKHFANAWCNGAPGIGLSRIAAWQLLGRDDDDLLSEARVALAATLRGLRRVGNNTLCHGRSGNMETLLRYADLRDEPAFRLEANVRAQQQWREVDDASGGMADDSASFFPGLMLGISGFGLHYLRLARPDRTPSVLLLDPPHDQ